MSIVTLSSKGQIVIPKAIREKLGLNPQKPVIVEIVYDHAEIRPVPDIKKALRGVLKGKPSMSRALAREHLSEVKPFPYTS
jgi:AbrB family looped-hinge helix DNA binding protein